jgi:cysteine desulfurase / selenocysteine lyase
MDVQKIRQDFPILTKQTLTYLDTAASSLTPNVVINKMNEYYYEYPVNVHRGVYQLSYKATEHYTKARENIARFINGSFEETVFTRGASSALNLVASSYGMNNLTKGDEIIVSELEHHSHVLPWQMVAKKTGATLKYIPLNAEGRITVENFKKILTDHTKVVALTYISNVMGYETPLKEIIQLAHAKGAVVSVDAAQAVPHKKVDVKALDCDFLAFSGHKMCGPTGIGVLYGKKALLEKMEPIEFGGDMNDYVDLFDAEFKDAPYKFETGTPPIAEAIGLSEAVDYLEAIGYDEILTHETMLKEMALSELSKIKGITIYNKTTETAIINFNIDGVHPHDAVSFFDQDHIALRAGHHCAQLVIKWLNVAATLRASFYIYNTVEDVMRFIDSVKRARTFFSEVGF